MAMFLAFVDGIYPNIYVADNRSVRLVAFYPSIYPSSSPISISPDGNRVVWFEDLKKDSGRFGTMGMFDTRTSISQRVAIPSNGGNLPLSVLFEPTSNVILSCNGGKILSWSNNAGWHELTELPKDAVPNERLTKGEIVPIDNADYAGTEPFSVRHSRPPLVEFACDGWNARRTVWVRPDGTVVELLRENDLPLRAAWTTIWTPLLFWSEDYWPIVREMIFEPLRQNEQNTNIAQKEVNQRAKVRSSSVLPTAPPSYSASGKQLTLDLGNKVTMKLVIIPAGKFMMGSPEGEKDRDKNEGPQHEVTISNPFYMGVYDVTLEQYEQIMDENPDNSEETQEPVQCVCWDDAVEFCEALSKKSGMAVSLPTEAQWEYACRAGSKTRFSYGDDDDKLGDYAWYLKSSDGKMHPVGQKKPNAWGLYDMHGNVGQWCSDWYGDYPSLIQTDPKGPASGKFHVLRGGSLGGTPQVCRSARRYPGDPGEWSGKTTVVERDSSQHSGDPGVWRGLNGSHGFRVVVAAHPK